MQRNKNMQVDQILTKDSTFLLLDEDILSRNALQSKRLRGCKVQFHLSLVHMSMIQVLSLLHLLESTKEFDNTLFT